MLELHQLFEVSPGEEVGLHPGPGELGILVARLVFHVFAINMKQIYRRPESKGTGLAVLEARTAAFERQGNDCS